MGKDTHATVSNGCSPKVGGNAYNFGKMATCSQEGDTGAKGGTFKTDVGLSVSPVLQELYNPMMESGPVFTPQPVLVYIL